jgi:hypothetical protein
MAEPADRGYWIRVFVPGGIPDGLRIVEKSDWLGQCLVWPRSLLSEVRKRRELDQPGVYVLLGPPTDTERPRVYVGEADPLRPRIDRHASQKDFWTSAAVLTAKDPTTLHKALIQHLEARLFRLAADAGRCEVDNANTPAPPSLSEAEQAEAEGFLTQALLCLPVIGIDVFEKPSEPAGSHRLKLKSPGISARGYETAQGFVVIAGSRAHPTEAPSTPPGIRNLRAALLREGVLVPDLDGIRVATTYVFKSPSAAAAVLLGRSANGHVEWVDEAGRTLRELQNGEADS